MQTERAVTLTEVARRAGVSLTTASKAINGQSRVSDDTRDRVLKAARELSYRPNRIARSLISGRSGTVGLVVVDSLAQRFALPILLGAEEALSEIDLSMIISDARGDEARLRQIVDRFHERKVDGVLVVGDNNATTPRVTRLDQPVAYVYGETDGGGVVHVPDDLSGARAVTGHLLATGRRRPAVITGPRAGRAVVERERGVRAALREGGVELVRGAVYTEWSQRSARAAAERLLVQAPDVDAILCGSDQLAAGVAEAVRASGRRIPDDVAITGYDNWPVFALESDPPLTTVDMNLQTLGAAAVRDLFGMIDGKPVGDGVRLHPCTLVVRGSTTAD
ncbi:LacI family transcriptional regulator [Streptomyces sp. 846.5]|nr:LacI family DNA-binding transcriptional regulator [Streptomyces sp. 846.5]TDT97483.1 LacI family transcriptional regulator [Streptomyces sp. 846.5]